ncbi:MAG: carboxypeptidase-like regulatory domain-containing protein [Bacteroidota bacterium]
MRFTSILCSLASVFFSISLWCQEEEFITGYLIDQNTREPVVFATIRLSSKALGVISNQDGSFRIPKRFTRLDEKIVISCLGYQEKELLFSELSLETVNQIRLYPKRMELNEAVLVGRRKRPPSARQIVKRAIERISRNYPSVPFAYVGYYRDYQLKKDEYLNLNEALLQVTDMGFEQNDFDHTKIQIYDYKPNYNFRRDSIADNPYNYSTQQKIIQNAFLHDLGGNELNILRIHDPIRNYDVKSFSFVDILSKDLLKNHGFSRQKDSEISGERMYVIHLEKDQSDGMEPYQSDHLGFSVANKQSSSPGFKSNVPYKATGTFYISQSTYAIHKFEYRVDDLSTIKKKRSKTKDTQNLIFEVALSYITIRGKMHLNYLSFQNVFTVNRSYFKVDKIILDLERKRLVVKTNKPPIFVVKQGEPNIIMRYKNKRIDIREIINTQDGIALYPDEKTLEEIRKEYERVRETSPRAMSDFFEFDFMNIKDRDGNLLNTAVLEEYHQFREFFTQKFIGDSIRIPPNDFLMKKDRPIFQNQPINKPDNFDEFWMNTPLQAKQ